MPARIRRRRAPGRPPGTPRLRGKGRKSAAGDLVTQVIDHLRRGIVSGSFSPGMALPSEGRLAETLAVSRTVIREAMRSLRSQGLVVMSQGTRPRIAALDPGPTVESLDLLLRRSRTTLLQLTEVRRPLESAIAGHAATRATESDVATLRASIIDLERAPNLETRVAADVRFHELLAEATGNPVFTVLLKTLGGLLGESRRRTIRTAGVEPALIGHREILAAVERHEPQAAATAMRRHLDWAEDNISRSAKGAGAGRPARPRCRFGGGADHPPGAGG